MLQLSEFAPLLREIAPGPLITPSAPGIIGPILGGAGVVDRIDGNLEPFNVYLLGYLSFFFKEIKMVSLSPDMLKSSL